MTTKTETVHAIAERLIGGMSRHDRDRLTHSWDNADDIADYIRTREPWLTWTLLFEVADLILRDLADMHRERHAEEEGEYC